MPRKCIACGVAYPLGLKLCPECQSPEATLLPEDAAGPEPFDGPRFCGVLMLIAFATALLGPQPRYALWNLVLGIALLIGVEKAVAIVAGLQVTALLFSFIAVFFVHRDPATLIGLGCFAADAVLILFMLSGRPYLVRTGVVGLALASALNLAVALMAHR
jgi:hypothetical protein